MLKTYALFAGVNGAGKSTFFRQLSKNSNIDLGTRINADEIVQKYFNHDWQNAMVQIKAGKQTIKLFRECLNGEKSFNQETTLTGKTIIRNIQQAKEKGFKIAFYYVGLENVQLSIDRVANRVKDGGHGIPTADLLRRYDNSLKNLREVLPLCDDIYIYDNSKDILVGTAKPLLVVKNRQIQLLAADLPIYIQKILVDFCKQL
ncbi:MAG: AAA family ATPase [Defluviitaleaceae bacterium]|nr:AAA family ATPase [Defluviitaleaceae bacterium]